MRGLGSEAQRTGAAIRMGVRDVHAASALGQDAGQELALRPSAEDQDEVAGPGPAAGGGVEGARERLGHRGERRREPRREGQRVPRDDRRGHAEALGEGPGEVDDRLAEVRASLAARPTGAAGGRVGDHDGVSDRGPRHAVAGLEDRPGDLVAQRRRERPEGGVRAGAHHLRVGRAGQGGVDAHHDLASRGPRIGHLLEAQVAGSVEDQGAHAR